MKRMPKPSLVRQQLYCGTTASRKVLAFYCDVSLVVGVLSLSVIRNNSLNIRQQRWHSRNYKIQPNFVEVQQRRFLKVPNPTNIPSLWCEENREESPLLLFSSFFGDFEGKDFGGDNNSDDEEDDEDDEDEDNDDDIFDDAKVANFRSKMTSLFGTEESSKPVIIDEESGGTVDDLITFARKQSDSFSMEEPLDWAKPVEGYDSIQSGCVLIGNPVHFCKDFKAPARSSNPLSNFLQPKIDISLLRRFGLSMPPPPELGPDRQADLLPVLLIVDHFNDDVIARDTKTQSTSSLKIKVGNQKRLTKAVLLNRRTGYLLGDMEQHLSSAAEALDDDTDVRKTSPASTLLPLLQKFCIQPLWFGGIDNPSKYDSDTYNVDDTNDVAALGLEMLHVCSAVEGSRKLKASDGLYWGGNSKSAADVASDTFVDPVTDKRVTGFDFKFFVQCTLFTEQELKKYVVSKNQQQQQQEPIFYVATVSKEVLFKSRDRMGTRRAKPLWTEILDLLGGKYASVKEQLYNGTNNDNNPPPGYYVTL